MTVSFCAKVERTLATRTAITKINFFMTLFLSFFIVNYWMIKISSRSHIGIKKSVESIPCLNTRVSTPIPHNKYSTP